MFRVLATTAVLLFSHSALSYNLWAQYINYNNWFQVVPPPPEEGTILASGCAPPPWEYIKWYRIADGNDGYTVKKEKSAECGYVPPEQGTVLVEGCGTGEWWHTRWAHIADGNDGYTTEKETYSEFCGYVPYGTILREGCGGEQWWHVKWMHVSDGNGGHFTKKESRSQFCGYVPTYSIEPVYEVGDRFKPVVFKIESDYEYDVYPEIGRAVKTETGVEIYGTGQTGAATVEFVFGADDVETYWYEIEPEPKCASQSYVDCEGNSYVGKPSGYIWYGEDDDQVVEWELAIFLYASTYRFGDDITVGLHREIPVPEDVQNYWKKRVGEYNAAYKRSGVHVRLVLKELLYAHWQGLSQADTVIAPKLNVDAYVAYGRPDGYCGVAYINDSFRKGYPVGGESTCGWATDLHEIGHNIGLAHGPNNIENQGTGYIFPEFGHGTNEIGCGWYADIMSYSTPKVSFANSKVTCEDMFRDITDKFEGDTNPAGYREFADSAYSINRVRYDVSLIHDENAPKELLREVATPHFFREKIID